LRQTELVIQRIKKGIPDVQFDIRVIKTQGDLSRDSLSGIEEKGVFVREIEETLLRGDIDAAVHSLKDLPTDLPSKLEISIYCQRGDARDVLVCRGDIYDTVRQTRLPARFDREARRARQSRLTARQAGMSLLQDLPRGARIGTGSPRRGAQLLSYRRDLEIKNIRGNVDTRLGKLAKGDYEAIVLAASGLERLGVIDESSSRIKNTDLSVEYINEKIMLPQAGQGALIIESRQGDERIKDIFRNLDHTPTRIACTAEIAFLKALGGGCSVPMAAFGYLEGLNDSGQPTLVIEGLVSTLDGRKIVRDKMSGSSSDPVVLGIALAEELMKRGAQEILSIEN
jgi:hydroxymethylbilane synthase